MPERDCGLLPLGRSYSMDRNDILFVIAVVWFLGLGAAIVWNVFWG